MVIFLFIFVNKTKEKLNSLRKIEEFSWDLVDNQFGNSYIVVKSHG